MKFHRFPKAVIALATCCVIAISARPVAGQEAMVRPMQINIDLRDLARKLVHVELTLPLTPATDKHRTIPIWYPKWVPGSHGPGGPIANIAGLKIEDPQGNRLPWVRTPGEVYRLEVTVPPRTDEVRVFLRYITNQPTTTSFGHDCFGASNIGVISPGSLLLCRETADIDVQQITARLQLPRGWQVATALETVEQTQEESSIVSYQAVSLRTLVDSPIMCGLHYQSFDLVENSRSDEIPKHTLHVFGDEAAHADLNQAVVEKLRAMVTQAALLIGSHPFDRFDILLAVSDELPKNGLEHSRSTFNVLPPRPLQSLNNLKGWDRLLIPHEYIHAWCGKYRRPAGMLTKDFHTPKDTELLWVYEGLTQYLGELVEARSGLMSQAEFRHRITVELRKAMHQQGRKWRTLADTAAASHVLRDSSPNWSGLRRSQDYYMEGMLFWLEADALIRRESDGARSLDDFCQKFLGSTATTAHPLAFTRADIVQELNAVADLDWDSLIRRRIESFQQEYDPTVASLLGYEFRLQSKAPAIPTTTFRRQSGVDVLDSLGMVVSRDGKVQTLLMGSPADQARLRPALKIIGVNGLKWSGSRLTDALVQGQDRRTIDLLVEDGDVLRTIQLHYYDGPRYWNMARQPDEPDLLRDILSKK